MRSYIRPLIWHRWIYSGTFNRMGIILTFLSSSVIGLLRHRDLRWFNLLSCSPCGKFTLTSFCPFSMSFCVKKIIFLDLVIDSKLLPWYLGGGLPCNKRLVHGYAGSEQISSVTQYIKCLILRTYDIHVSGISSLNTIIPQPSRNKWQVQEPAV